MTDPIADFLTRIKNASHRLAEKVDMPSSKIKVSIARLLKAEGFIANYKVMEDGAKRPFLRIYLKYNAQKQESIQGLRRLSRPGLRYYKPYDQFEKKNHAGIVTIVSTSKGILTDRQALQAKVGGEVLCQVW